MRFRLGSVLFGSTAVALLVSCGGQNQVVDDAGGGGGGSGGYSYSNAYRVTDPNEIKFHDDVDSNVQAVDDVTSLQFMDASGNATDLKDYVGEKNIVLVMTRGYAGAICLFCSTQTSRLISRYNELAVHDAEVVIVYPVKTDDHKSHLDELLKSSKEQLDDPTTDVPFPVLLDVELKAVDQLGIRRNLSKPATYILDKKGNVRFAYVGRGVEDRPSVDAIIEQLKQLKSG